MNGSYVCIYVFRDKTDRSDLPRTERKRMRERERENIKKKNLCTDIYIHRNYMNNLFFQRAYHIIFIRDLSEVSKLFVRAPT